GAKLPEKPATTSPSQSTAASKSQPVEPPPAARATTERRKATRRPGKRVAAIIAPTNPSGKRYVCRVIDGSTGGLCLALPWALSVGSVVKVRASNAGLAIPWVNIRVKHCRRANHQWHVGFQFTDTVTPEVLETFC